MGRLQEAWEEVLRSDLGATKLNKHSVHNYEAWQTAISWLVLTYVNSESASLDIGDSKRDMAKNFP